jgi:hypothetical protein
MGDHWRDVFVDQINKINSSGLYDKSERIYLGILSDGYDFSQFGLNRKYEIMFNRPNIEMGELPTIERLHQFCQKESCKVWYIHTKGVSRPYSASINDWRRYMEYFVIEKNDGCIEALNEFDACGVDWYTEEEIISMWHRRVSPHFSGNFWWANSEYIRKLPPIDVNGSRMEAETFIGKGNANVKCFHKSHKQMYLQRFPSGSYKFSKPFKLNLNI